MAKREAAAKLKAADEATLREVRFSFSIYSYIYIYICVCLCICVYIYIYIYICKYVYQVNPAAEEATVREVWSPG